MKTTTTQKVHVFAANARREELITFLTANEITFEEAKAQHGSFRLNISAVASKIPEVKGKCKKLKLGVFEN